MTFRVVVAEDEALIRLDLVEMLNGAGYEVVGDATNGAQAIELVRELPSGAQEIATTATVGEYFGEMGPLFALPRSATARARTAATVVSYTVQGFRELMGAGGSREIIEHKQINRKEPD